MSTFSDFHFSFTDTQILFSTDNNDFRNSQFTMTIKDSNGLTWVNNDILINGSGGSGFTNNSDGIYFGSSTVQLPLSVEVLIDHGSGHLFNYSVTSDSNGSTDLSNANVDYIKPLEIYNYNGLFKVHDLFLNAGETYSYQIVDRPSYVAENDTLVSASLEPHIWWSNPEQQWLTVTNDGLLQGTADFGYKDNSQGYNLILNYDLGGQVNEFFEVYVNSYVETNTWSHDQNYNLRYDYEPLNVYGAQNLSLNLSDPSEPKLELRLFDAFNYNPFYIIDQSGADITGSLDFASGNLFKIHHTFINGEVEGGDEVQVIGHEWRDGGSVLSIKIQPNLYNGQSVLGPDDIFQVSLAQGVQIGTYDGTLTPLSNIIPSELIYQDTVPFEDKVSIETTDRWDGYVIDTSVPNNLFGYSGVYINAGPSEVTHSDGSVIPAYSSIAPDGTVLDISAISAEEHGLEIRTSPLDDVIYVDAEEGDGPVVGWSAGDDYILGPNSGVSFKGSDFNNWHYGNQDSSEGLTFEFNAGILTVASEYGTTTAENVRNVYGTHGNDVFLGDENYQNFRGDGGYDTFTGGAGEDHFRLESQTENDPNSSVDVLIESYARITDFENDDKISIEDYGFDTDKTVLENQFSVTQNESTNKTYISIATPEATINNMFEIDGIFYLDSFYTEIEEENSEINLRIKLTDEDPPNYIFGNNDDIDIDGTELVDWIYSNSGDKVINAYAGDDYIIQSGAGTHTYDGGAGNDTFQNDLSYATNLPDGFINEINLQTSFAGSYYDREHPSNDVITNIENVRTFGDIDHVLIGDVNDNILSSTGGNDIIRGGEGDDTLSSGAGNDSVYGEDGDDTVIQNGSGTQLYDGGEGVDTYVLDLEDWSFADDFVGEVNFTTNFSGAHLDPTHALNDQVYEFENITLKGDVDFIMIGDDNNNTIITDGGNDKLYGGVGNDLLSSGDGNDFIYGEDGDDLIIHNGSGKQEYHGGLGNDTLKIDLTYSSNLSEDFVGEVDLVNGWNGPENDPDHELSDKLSGIENIKVIGDKDYIIRGDEQDNILKSDSGDDYLYGGDGNDVLKSGAGDDFIYGEAGDDILILNGSGTQEFDGGEGIDTFKLDHTSFTRPLNPDYEQVVEIDLIRGISGQKDNVNLQDTLISIENIKYQGSTDVEMTGDSNDNIIYSHHGNDIIYAGGGNDFINSGDGSDVITTGSGLDTIVIKPGHVNYTLGGADRITDFEDGSDQFALDGMSFSDITIEQGIFGEYVNHTILTTSDGWLGVLENTTASDVNADDFYPITATFTTSIDKWQPGGQTSSNWLDGPSMKLHHKDVDGITNEVGIDLTSKAGFPGHKHKPDMDKGNYELRVEHNQQTDGAIDIDDVMGVLSLSRGKSSPTSKEHKLAADWNGDGIIDIDDVMGVLARSRGKSKEDEWRFHDKTSDTSLWDNATKTNKIDIVLDQDDQIDLTAILRGDVNASYNAGQHNRADPSPAPTPNYAPLPINNDDELLSLQVDLI